MSHHSVLVRLIHALRGARAGLSAGHMAALSAGAVMALGLLGLRTVELPEPRPVTEGDRLQIEVVHPVEPDIAPGTVMEVGELVDGFQGLPPPRPTFMDMFWPVDQGWDDIWEPPPPPRRTSQSQADYPRPAPPSPADALQRWFGFDAPRRDFQAERAARRARLEAMEQSDRERRDAERRRHQRAELDRYHREGWRPVPIAPPRRGASRRRDEPRNYDWRDEPGHNDLSSTELGPQPAEGPDPYSRPDVGLGPMAGSDEQARWPQTAPAGKGT